MFLGGIGVIDKLSEIWTLKKAESLKDLLHTVLAKKLINF